MTTDLEKEIDLTNQKYKSLYKSLYTLLTEYTSDMGSWFLEFNPHKGTHETPEQYFSHNEDILEDLAEVDTSKDIYYLQWYNETSIGFYSIFANSEYELTKKVLEIIVSNNLFQYRKCEGISLITSELYESEGNNDN